ncbi:FIP1[III]-like protein isoform X2 [Vitis riparia]|nr:FIP1[III]-like protein isoform X2 [Vitis riparia]
MHILNQTPVYPVYHSSKPNQTEEGGLEHEKDGQEPVCKQGSIVSPTSKSTDRLELPKGRAIQVEGSTGERQPSMDVRRPRHRDSGVVIHIAVQDSVDDEIDNIDSTEDESSENGDFKVGDNKDIHCYGSGNGNKPCLEKNVTLDRSSVLKRSSKLSTASNPVSVDSDNVGTGKIPDGDRHCSQNMNACVPEGISEVVDALNNSKEMVGRNTCNTDPCMMETELSLDEQVSHSPSSSRRGSHSEASQDGGYIDPEKNQNARRKPSSNLLTDRPELIKSEYYLHKSSKNKVGKTKPIDHKDSFRNRSPVQEAWKHRDSSACSVDKMAIRSGNDVASPMSKTVDSLYDRNHSSVGNGRQKERLHDFGSHDDDVSPMSNSEGLHYKHYLSAGRRRRKERLCDLGSYDGDFSPMSDVEGMHSRAHSSVVRQGRKERLYDFGSYDNDIFPVSETEGLSDKGHSFASRRRRKEQLHDFDSYDQKGFSYYRETELSFNYCSEKFADNHVQTACAENPHWKDHRSFRDEMYPHFRNKYIFEKRITRAGNKMMERDWYHRERNVSIEDIDTLTHRESRRLVLKYSYSDKERDTRRRKKNDKLQFQEGPDNDDDLFQCKNTDDVAQEKITRSVPFMCKERNSLAEKYGRHVPSTGRKVNLYGRRKRYEDGHLDLDSSWSIGVEDEYGRHVDHQSLSSRSYREPHTANGRNDVNDSRLTERHGRDRRQICPQGHRESDWFGNDNDAYNTKDSIIGPDDQVHIGRRRSRRQYEALHWTEKELISSHLDENLYNEEASLSYERTSGHTRIHTKYGSAHVGMLVHNKKSQQQRYKRIREGRSDDFINRSSNVLGQGNHEQTVLRSRASVDLIVGEGKSSGRRSEARSAVHHDRFENMDWKIDEDQGILKDVNGPQRGKIIQPDLKSESNWNNEKCLDKFLVTEHDEALDIEEGQIIPEEMNKDDSVETKYASESITPSRNVKRRLGNANAANGNKVVAECDNQRILQTLAKMEKRQERFKEPITLKKEPDKIPKPQVDPIVEMAETMQQRPLRKRRWNGS